MDNKPLVSILIPNYNKAPYLRETLESVLAQTYTNWECIIVDDHSTDESWEILEDYASKDSRFKIFKRPDNLPKGGNACRNYAFELSKGDYINWFDSDDVLTERFIYLRVEVLSYFNLDFVVFGGVLFKYNIDSINGYFLPFNYYPNFLFSFLIISPSWCTLSVMFKRSFLQSKKLFWDEELLGFQDILFNLKALISCDKFIISIDYFDFYWRDYIDSKRVSFNPYSLSRLKNIRLFYFKILEIKDRINDVNFKNYYLISLYKSVLKMNKHYSFYWFRVFFFPFFVKGYFKFKDLAVVMFWLIGFYFFKLLNKRYNNYLDIYFQNQIRKLKVSNDFKFPLELSDYLHLKKYNSSSFIEFKDNKFLILEK